MILADVWTWLIAVIKKGKGLWWSAESGFAFGGGFPSNVKEIPQMTLERRRRNKG